MFTLDDLIRSAVQSAINILSPEQHTSVLCVQELKGSTPTSASNSNLNFVTAHHQQQMHMAGGHIGQYQVMLLRMLKLIFSISDLRHRSWKSVRRQRTATLPGTLTTTPVVRRTNSPPLRGTCWSSTRVHMPSGAELDWSTQKHGALYRRLVRIYFRHSPGCTWFKSWFGIGINGRCCVS